MPPTALNCMKSPTQMSYVAVLAFLSLFTILFAVGFVDFSIAPFEDAAMLMRYSDHFAKGYGIVWNVGDKPVDGATDFLFMIVVGLFVKGGLSLEFATRLIGFSSHILTAAPQPLYVIFWQRIPRKVVSATIRLRVRCRIHLQHL